MPIQVLNRSARDEIYRRTRDAVQYEVGTVLGQCLEFAWHGYRIIREWPSAPRTIIQAGSVQWPRIPTEMDDGLCDTHFAYEWDAQSEVARMFRSGTLPVIQRGDGRIGINLPEMHVWLACPESNEIIDFTTGQWPDACKATIGEDWFAPRPPDYLWTFGTRLPASVRYTPAVVAIDFILAVLRFQDRDYP